MAVLIMVLYAHKAGYNSICPAESPILLWIEIPMAWGTTIESLTPKINPFLYERETKYLTIKDLDPYLIPEG